MRRLVLAVLILTPVIAEGQTERAYVGASLGSHIEDADRVTGISPAVSVVTGFRFSSRWGIEAEVSKPTEIFTREYSGVSQSFAGPGASQDERERLGVLESFRTERTVRHTISIGAVYRMAVRGRVHPRLFMGLTNHNVGERSINTILRLPKRVDPERLRNVRGSIRTGTRQLGGLSFGAGVAVAITPHLSIAPELRYDYGSIGDEINNVLRTSVRAVWSF
jgi:hypothetical protein